MMRSTVLSLCLLTVCVVARAQSPHAKPAPDSLFQTIASLDAAFFDAYNKCDLEKAGSLVDDGLEFYHDQTGLSVGKQNLLDALKLNICGKVRRDLVPGTLEVYPLKGYGAVEIGVHRFSHPGIDQSVGQAKFITIWQNKDGAWKITRAISFDHGPVTK